MIDDQRIDRRQVPGLRVLLAILVAFGCYVAHELERRPVLSPALVLEQQVDRQCLAPVADPIDQIGISAMAGSVNTALST